MKLENTITGHEVILAPTNFGLIADLDTTNFDLGGSPFIVKNEGESDITLSVKPVNGDSFVDTVFKAGEWGLENVKEIEANATYYENIKWGR